MGKKIARVIIFGTGNVYKWSSEVLQKYTEILFFIDNDKTKWNTYIDGRKIVSPVSVINDQYDYIVLASYYYVCDMRRQLYDLGCNADKIIHIYELIKRIYDSGNVEFSLPDVLQDSKSVLLISKHAGLGGGEIALANMATVFKNNGYQVVMFMPDAEDSYISLLNNRQIQYVICPYVYYPSGKILDWICEFDYVVANTIIMSLASYQICKRRPVIEWIHECRYMMYQYSLYFSDKFEECFYNSNTRLYTVSSVAHKCLKDMFPKCKDEILPYGIEDTCAEPYQRHRGNYLNFAIIGRVEKNKGDDIVIDAIEKVNAKYGPDEVNFLFIGKKGNNSVFAQDIINEIDGIPNTYYLGELSRKEMRTIYEQKIDVVIVASRQECLPTTAAEAMMFSHPSIVCDACGMTDYIHDRVDGIIFHSEDADDLSKKIIWCLDNRDDIRLMGDRARDLFDREFSLKVFGNGVMDIVNF